MDIPGFTAEASLYKKSGRYQSLASQTYSAARQSVISQMRGGIGGGALAGFWTCAACVVLCCLIEDCHACLDACVASGACEPTTITT
jgi:hypothetical protein